METCVLLLLLGVAELIYRWHRSKGSFDFIHNSHQDFFARGYADLIVGGWRGRGVGLPLMREALSEVTNNDNPL